MTGRSLRQEEGQVVAAFVLLLAMLLAVAGLVVDVGNAYRAHRALQASADAAALAGGQELPDASRAVTVAQAYGASPAGRNQVRSVTTKELISTRCLTSIPGCSPVNAVVVEENGEVPTVFLRVVGLDSFHLKARATACSPCGSRPVDVVMVLDRTGSMCEDSRGNIDSNCTDLKNAQAGIRTFLGFMNPQTQWVGLAVFPPATSVGTRCSTPSSTNYGSRTAAYTVVPLSSDYKTTSGTLNTSSNLVSTLNCIKGNGSTAYANAIEAAQAELDAHGRPTVQDVIVFMSDGAANTGPSYYPATSPYLKQPCHQGVTSSGYSKARKTIVYSIGYALEDDTGGCKAAGGGAESPAITALEALQGIASPGNFYNKPTPGQLNTIYTQIAIEVSRGTSGLVDDATP